MHPRAKEALDALGIPDPEARRICVRCGKWVRSDEGSVVEAEGRFARNYTLSTGSSERFRCARCSKVRLLTQYGIGGTFIGLLLLIWLLTSLGVMK